MFDTIARRGRTRKGEIPVFRRAPAGAGGTGRFAHRATGVRAPFRPHFATGRRLPAKRGPKPADLCMQGSTPRDATARRREAWTNSGHPPLPARARTAGRPTNRATGRPTNRATGRPTNRATDEPGDRATGRPTNRATGRPTNRATEPPSDRTTERPSHRATEPPSDRATERPAAGPGWRRSAAPVTRSVHPVAGPGCGIEHARPDPAPAASVPGFVHTSRPAVRCPRSVDQNPRICASRGPRLATPRREAATRGQIGAPP
jgi:hypothetical protein